MAMGCRSGLEIFKHTEDIYLDTYKSKPRLKKKQKMCYEISSFSNWNKKINILPK